MNFFDDMSRLAGATALISEDGRTTSFQALAAEADAFGFLLSRRALVFILADSCIPAVLGYWAACVHGVRLCCWRGTFIPTCSATSSPSTSRIFSGYRASGRASSQAERNATASVPMSCSIEARSRSRSTANWRYS